MTQDQADYLRWATWTMWADSGCGHHEHELVEGRVEALRRKFGDEACAGLADFLHELPEPAREVALCGEMDPQPDGSVRAVSDADERRISVVVSRLHNAMLCFLFEGA